MIDDRNCPVKTTRGALRLALTGARRPEI